MDQTVIVEVVRSSQSVLGLNLRIEPVGAAMDWIWCIKEGGKRMHEMTTTIKIEKAMRGAGC